MMNCQANIRNLGEVMDGTAPLMRRFLFFMHIAICSECRTYYKQFKRIREACSTIEPEDLPEDFFEVMETALKRIETK